MSPTGIEAWKEWKDRCAYGRCGDATREMLRTFLGPQLSAKYRELKNSRKFGEHAGAILDLMDWDAETEERQPAVIAWNLLDAYLLLPPSQKKKEADADSAARQTPPNPSRPPAKEALFEGKKNLNHLEATVSLKLRDVLRWEINQRSSRQGSIDGPVAEGANETLKDRIQDDEETAAERASRLDAENRAAALAENCSEQMEPVHRIILGAHARGLSLSDALVEERAGLKKSQLRAHSSENR